jgi:predicted phage baseplate assembly protein
MKLPEIALDDRDFQDLVNEARLRIAQSCPEWTEHNVSDPGITLIELFAWMTDLTIYRLNRLPDKLHVALLELLGIELDPPAAAHAELRFRLVDGLEETVRIPGGTEVGTARAGAEEPVIFQVTDAFEIAPLRPAAYVLRRGGQITDIGIAQGIARPTGQDQPAFGSPPGHGDALHLGFEESVARLVLRVDVEASPARGVGIDPERPPLRWEVSAGDGTWLEAQVLEDLTGGFNYGSGSVELQLPARSGVDSIGGHRLHWVRCRFDEDTPAGRDGATYTHPPHVYEITAAPVGAALAGAHATVVRHESLGISDGTPGQVFPLRARPVLPLAGDEYLEVQDPETGDWQQWEARDTLALSGPFDRHFVLDRYAGQIELGPAIRQSDGDWRQYGAVPPKDAQLRITAYRHGGGRDGNVAGGTLTMLKTAVPGVDRVTNPRAASGGVDAESLESARQRAGIELRTSHRAVTAGDYEYLACEATPTVARAVCLAPQEAGDPITVRLLPRIDPADRALTHEELTPTPHTYETVAAHLDERRAIGTSVALEPVRLRGVSVVVNLQAAPNADVVRIADDVEHALYTYLNPLVGGRQDGPGDGWPFGRPLNQGELYGIIHAIDGVEFVKLLRIYETDLVTGEQQPKPAGTHLELAPDEVIASGTHIVRAERRER